MSVSGLPFDDIRELIANLPSANEDIASIADERSARLKLAFGYGEAEANMARWLAAWSGKSPSVTRPMIALFAGTHGVVEQSADFPGETTLARVTRMAAGGAPINQVCATHDIGLKVFDLALQFPVADITTADALDEKGCAATIGFGMEAIAGGVDFLGLAAFGQGDQICNAAIMHILTGDPLSDFLTIQDGSTAKRIIAQAEAVVKHHAVSSSDPLELLRRMGGREHSALLGGILAARVNHVPAVLDGESAIVVATILHKISPPALDHCLFSVVSQITGYKKAQKSIGIAYLQNGLAPSDEAVSAGHVIAMVKSIAAVHGQSVIEMPES